MSGTVSGAKKAAETNKARHGKDFYVELGRIGGRKSRNGGFASSKVGKDGLTGVERAKIAGAKGGKKSKRGPAKKTVIEVVEVAEEEKPAIGMKIKKWFSSNK